MGERWREMARDGEDGEMWRSRSRKGILACAIVRTTESARCGRDVARYGEIWGDARPRLRDRLHDRERVGERGDRRRQVEDEDGLREAGGGGEVAVACEEKRACLARS